MNINFMCNSLIGQADFSLAKFRLNFAQFDYFLGGAGSLARLLLILLGWKKH